MVGESEAETAEVSAWPKAEPLWKVYVEGSLRQIYAIDVDDAGKRSVSLQVWFGAVTASE